MKKIFFSKDEKLQIFCKKIIKNKNNYKQLIETLRYLGDFDEQIELFKSSFKNEICVIDNKESKFYFKMPVDDFQEIMNIKKVIDNHCITYLFYKPLKPFSKLNITIIKEGYMYQNGYVLDIFPSKNNNLKKYQISKNGTVFSLVILDETNIDENKLIESMKKVQNISFIDFFNLIKNIIDVKRIKSLNLSAEKNNKNIGIISIIDGELIKFKLVDETSNEKIELNLNKDNLLESVVEIKKIEIEDMPEGDLKIEAGKARRLVKEFKNIN